MNYENTTKTFSERLRALRTEAKLTQKQCAEQLGVETHNYNKWENEVSPPLGMICRIAKHFSVTTDYLFGVEDSRTHDGQAVFEKLRLSDKAVQVLIENNTVKERFYRDNAYNRNTDEMADRYARMFSEDGAYAKLINLLLESETLKLAVCFNRLIDVLSIRVVTGDNATPSDEEDEAEKTMGAGYLSYLCIKEFMGFLDKCEEDKKQLFSPTEEEQ